MPADVLTLWALFLSAFVASTLLPGGSEVVLAALAYQGQDDPWTLLLVATAGNTLGGMSTWAVGRFVDWWYPSTNISQPKYQRAMEWVRRWGSPVLILSWVPVVGDPLCLAGGWLRIHWVAALFWIGLGKAARYAVIVYAAS
jgi:membrane protein YqaA with SNARE-associated domain